MSPVLVKYVPLYKSIGAEVVTGAAVVVGAGVVVSVAIPTAVVIGARVVTGASVVVGARVVVGNPKYSCTYFVYGSLGLSVMYLLTAP